MNILIDIGHPAHVHLFRNVVPELMKHGHKVYVTTKQIPSATKLLDIYGIPYTCIGKKHDSLWMKALDQFIYGVKLLGIVWIKKIDIGIHGITVAHVSKLSPMKSILPDDDDDSVEPLFAKYAHPFADVILSPAGTERKSRKALFVNTYHELAYLHPNNFTPDPSVLDEIGISPGEPFFIVRFNAFKAHHDIGAVGLTMENRIKLIEYLTKKGKVFITTERDIDEKFKPYQLKVSPEKIHSLLFYATLFIGDSQTMTTEASVLGTPAIRCNSFVGRIHCLQEEEESYGLTYGFIPEQVDKMFLKIDELLAIPNLKEEWRLRREKMLSEKIDYAQFLVWFIESYPESDSIMRENPAYQWRFK